MLSLSSEERHFLLAQAGFDRRTLAVESVHISIEPILVELAKVLFQNVLQRAAPYPVAHGQFGGGFDQAIEGHNLGQDPSFAPEAGSSENLVQSQPLPNLMANVDCSRLAGLFDLNEPPLIWRTWKLKVK